MHDLKKRGSFLFLIGLLLFLGFTSCKKKRTGIAPVDDPSDTVGRVEASFSKAVLLVEFKGHKCGNCPAGTEIGQQIKSTYGSRVVVVSAHVGTLAQPQPAATGKYIYDFRTALTDEWDDKFGASVSGIPKGAINFETFGGRILLLPQNWGGKVSELLQQDSIPFGLKASLEQVDSLIKLTPAVQFGDSIEGKFNLGALLTEDSIVQWQKDYRLSSNQDIEFYQHDNVIRGNFHMPGNPAILPWGVELADSAFSEGDIESLDMEIVLKEEWKPDHLKVIVFLFNRSKETIIQIREIPFSEFN